MMHENIKEKGCVAELGSAEETNLIYTISDSSLLGVYL